MDRIQIPQLTFTRFLAAVLIVLFHFGRQAYPFDSGFLNKFASYGLFSVSYFFFLSGFIMTVAYHSCSFTDTRSNLLFWNARIARIYPMFILALFSFIIIKVIRIKTPPDVISLMANLCCLQAWIPGRVLLLNSPG